jgi:general secretion pathway protein K
MMRALRQQSGAAILAAMLTVTLVATFAATAIWQQYRAIEVETAERARVQSGWLSTAALDWARLILREDARAGSADHLAEPWAILLTSTQLSSFLSLDKGDIGNEKNTSLSGQIIDLQSRLNVANLVDGKALSASDLNSFARLFELLGLPSSELVKMANQLLKASSAQPNADLMPQRVDQLVWLGLSPQTLAALSPYITLLPQRTPVNLNTASAEVIFASTPDMSLGDVRKLVALRDASYFRSLADVVAKTGDTADQFNEGRHGVASGFFEVRTTLKLNQTSVEERATIKRDGLNMRVLWRDRGAVASSTPAPPAAR